MTVMTPTMETMIRQLKQRQTTIDFWDFVMMNMTYSSNIQIVKAYLGPLSKPESSTVSL